jgi:hypothetical protein
MYSSVFAAMIALGVMAATPDRHFAAQRAEATAKNFARSVEKKQQPALRIFHINDDGIHEPIVSEVVSYSLTGKETSVKVSSGNGPSHVILDLKLERKKENELCLSGKFDVAVIYEGRTVPGMPAPIGQGSSLETEFRSKRLTRGEPLYLGSSTHLNSPGQPTFEDTSSLFLIWN